MKVITSEKEVYMTLFAHSCAADLKCAGNKHTEHRHLPMVDQEPSLPWEIHFDRYCSLHRLVCVHAYSE